MIRRRTLREMASDIWLEVDDREERSTRIIEVALTAARLQAFEDVAQRFEAIVTGKSGGTYYAALLRTIAESVRSMAEDEVRHA